MKTKVAFAILFFVAWGSVYYWYVSTQLSAQGSEASARYWISSLMKENNFTKQDVRELREIYSKLLTETEELRKKVHTLVKVDTEQNSELFKLVEINSKLLTANEEQKNSTIRLITEQHAEINEIRRLVEKMNLVVKVDNKADNKEAKGTEVDTKTKYGTGVVFTSFLIGKTDPQREGLQHSANLEEMYNLVVSANFLKVHVFIFHDFLPKDFQNKYKTSYIRFITMENVPDASTNDARFMAYAKLVQALDPNVVSHILAVDLFDAYFQHDPFEYMRKFPHRELFLAPDIDTWSGNEWVRNTMSTCFGEPPTANHPAMNAGVIGGSLRRMSCIFNCVAREGKLSRSQGYTGNCDMAHYNVCVRSSECFDISDRDFTEKHGLVNDFRKNCTVPTFPVIHNKCYETPDLCVIVPAKGGRGGVNVIQKNASECAAQGIQPPLTIGSKVEYFAYQPELTKLSTADFGKRPPGYLEYSKTSRLQEELVRSGHLSHPEHG